MRKKSGSNPGIMALAFQILFLPNLVFANGNDGQQHPIFARDHDVLRQVLEQLPSADVANFAVTSKFVRNQVVQAGYVLDQVEIRSYQQLQSDYPQSKLFHVKFHSDISKKDLFDCLRSSKIVGQVDVQGVTALSDSEKADVENGLVMTFPLGGNLCSNIDVFYSPDGATIVGVENDESIRLWNSSTGELKHALVPKMQNIYPVKISKDSKFISMILDKEGVFETVLFDVESGRTVPQPDTPIIWAGNEGYIESEEVMQPSRASYRIRGREKPITLHEPVVSFEKPIFSRDWTMVTMNSRYSKVKVWDIETGEGQIFVHDKTSMDRFVSADFSPDSEKLITSEVYIYDHDRYGNFNEDRTDYDHYMTKVWDIKAEKVLLELPFTYGSSFSPDGKFILTKTGEKTIKVWNADRAFRSYKRHMKEKEAKKLGNRIKSGFKKLLNLPRKSGLNKNK